MRMLILGPLGVVVTSSSREGQPALCVCVGGVGCARRLEPANTRVAVGMHACLHA